MSLKIGNLGISSSAFEQHGKIPRKYTYDGENRSPPISWKGLPTGTRQLALVCFDPDAPLPRGFTHWVIYGIPPDANGIPEGGGGGFVQGLNGMRKPGYMGPAPPQGHGVHHYYFWLYALGDGPEPKAGLNFDDLLDAIGGRILGQARLVGTYER
ncbi:MAG TPA: YbhB/YbcL family Raf kinase inhibitor-like protein [Nitrososphaerales archaeon]|nr:YbhB/YbcL family Raf kinase inhibitor-like protein [Nitrososphaerales archaeon]